MKIATLTVVFLMSGSLAQAELRGPDATTEVTVCISGQDPRLIPGSLALARKLASDMFSGVGVTINWHNQLRTCPAEGIKIDMSYQTPASLEPGVLAYALPFEGTHIRVFYDRILRTHDKSLVAKILAHVLAHEITHLLQGVSRHSATGVMKAHWGQSDFRAMSVHTLPFEDQDVEWIFRGLSARSTHTAARSNGPALDALAAAGQ